MSQITFRDPYVVGGVSQSGGGTLTIDRTTHFSISQTYTLTCIATSPDIVFSVVGSLDGPVGLAVVGTQFYDSDLKIFLTIQSSGPTFVVGNTFTFEIANGTDLNQLNIDEYDELPQKNFGAGVTGQLKGDDNVRFNNSAGTYNFNKDELSNPGGFYEGNADTNANIVYGNSVKASPGAGNGFDVKVAGDLSIGTSVGPHTITVGVSGSTTLIPGNLTVQGVTTSLQTTNTLIKDKNIDLNNGGNDATSEGAGITIDRTGTAGSLVYQDSLQSKFKIGAQGSEIEVATTGNQQGFTNKTFLDAITNAQIATPSAPASGRDKLYFKSDDKLYRMDASGNELAVDTVGSVKADLYDPLSTTLPTTAPLTLDGVVVVSGHFVLFSNLSSGNNRVYKATVTGFVVSWQAQSVYTNGANPSQGEEIRIRYGTGFRGALGYYDVDSDYFNFNDFVRHYSGTDYWEQASIKTLALDNNTTDTVFSVAFVGSENMIMDYSILRGTSKETGTLHITTDGSSVEVAGGSAYIGVSGVSFSGVISGADLILYYTTDSAGSDGVLKYIVRRWSSSAGGPGGIPDYSTSSVSSVGAAGLNKQIQFNSGGNLGASNAFTFDSATNTLTINGLEYVGLSSPITLTDNIVSPTTAFSYIGTTYPFVVVEYSILRGVNLTHGKLIIVSDGSSVSSSAEDIKIGDDGIALTVTAGAGTVSVKYVSTSTGQNATFKYAIRRWA